MFAVTLNLDTDKLKRTEESNKGKKGSAKAKASAKSDAKSDAKVDEDGDS